MEHKRQTEQNRTCYFGNVKTRLGAKLPTESQGFITGPWENQAQGHPNKEARDSNQSQQHAAGRPLDHIPHIRNPRLRQYYLQGATWEPNCTTVKSKETDTDNVNHPGDTVFSITSQISGSPSPTDSTEIGQHPFISSSSSSSSSSTLVPRQHLLVPKSKTNTSSRGSCPLEPNFNTKPRQEPELGADSGSSPVLPPSPHSPSPDAEYDKLLDVEAVPMPDGQLCLLALPPECSQGEGPKALPYLKLFCRYITDRKGVVSGILLVTSNKLFFDPCKSHPLVVEHGWEEYLVSCSVDCLRSISFFSDIRHVHFNSSTHRWKGNNRVERFKNTKSLQEERCSSPSNHSLEPGQSAMSAETSDTCSTLAVGLCSTLAGEQGADSTNNSHMDNSPQEVPSSQQSGVLGVAVLSSAATFCCGGQDAETTVKMELMHQDMTENISHMKNVIPGQPKSSSNSSGGLMFVRLLVQRSSRKTKSVGGLLGTKSSPLKDTWFTMSQESSDELHAYLSHWRPDLCILERGEEEAEGERGDEEFVLVDDEEEENEDEEKELMSQMHGHTVDDWEMVSVEEGGIRTPQVMDKDADGLREIVEQSHILKASHVRELSAELPPRTVGHAWQLAYSTSKHGSSLKSLYRRLKGTDSPMVIVIKDALDQVFGGFLSHPLRPSEKFYGTGETFLFMLHPRFKCFRWTGENSFFIKGDMDSFAIGGGSGHFGLWLDETLYLGRSSPCYTFNNCCLSETDDFRVMELEAWTFC